MTQYTYYSMDARGKIVRSGMDAANVADLDQRLKRMDLDLIDAAPTPQALIRFGRRALKRQDLINFCFYMEQLSVAGVPLLDGLADLRDSTDNPRLRETVAALIEDIKGGSQMSEAMARHPHIFDTTFVSLVMAGEQSGKIGEVFKNLIDNLKWQDELTSQTKKVMIYPAFVCIFVLAATFFLMTYLVPQLAGFIKNMGKELPIYTKVLIFVSSLFTQYWHIMLVCVPILWTGFALLIKHNPRARFLADEYKLRVWIIGPIIHKVILARFAVFFALMYSSGITILDCIRLSEKIVNNEFISSGLERARQFILKGNGVTEGFQNAGIFPPLVVRMLKVGESTGSLDRALFNITYFYNREVKESVEKMQVMIEPVMTVVFGILLGWIMLAVLGPVYDTISKIKM